MNKSPSELIVFIFYLNFRKDQLSKFFWHIIMNPLVNIILKKISFNEQLEIKFKKFETNYHSI